METSTIISLIYFSANLILVLLLGYYVKIKGEHESIKTRAFFKDVWSQRKVYVPLIVHFYDTATDIGIVYYWWTLMQDETQSDIDYKTVNMTVFFWCGITFLLFYRFLALIGVICHCSGFGDDDEEEEPGDWYDIILVLLDIYIFKAVYNSFKKANEILAQNAAIRKKNKTQKNMEKSIELQVQTDTAATHTNSDENEPQKGEVSSQKEKEQELEISLADSQWYLQLGESMTESMPQIILQSVFVIRSYNDPRLRDGNVVLIGFSILASLFSIASKFLWIDTDASGDDCAVVEKAMSMRPKMSFPNCVSYWHILLTIWRMSDIMSKFAIHTLMWAVLGGAWLGIWVGFIIIFWGCYYCRYQEEPEIKILVPFFAVAGLIMVNDGGTWKLHILRLIENIIGLSTIGVFAVLDFDCGICTSSDSRSFVNEAGNNRILMFFVVGCLSASLEFIVFFIMKINDIFVLY